MGPTETKSHFAEAKWDCADETSWQHIQFFGRSSLAGLCITRRHWAQATTGLAQRRETQVQMTKWQSSNRKPSSEMFGVILTSPTFFPGESMLTPKLPVTCILKPLQTIHVVFARIVNPVTKSPLENHDHCGYNATVDMKIIWIYGCLSTSSHQNMAWRNLTNKILSSIWCFSCWGSILNQIYLMPGERLKPGAQ